MADGVPHLLDGRRSLIGRFVLRHVHDLSKIQIGFIRDELLRANPQRDFVEEYLGPRRAVLCRALRADMVREGEFRIQPTLDASVYRQPTARTTSQGPEQAC